MGQPELAEILSRIVDAHSVGELAGIHAIVGVPEHLEFAKGLDEFRAEHLGQQSGARLAIAVFAGERSAEREHNIGGALDEFAEDAQPSVLRKSKLMRV